MALIAFGLATFTAASQPRSFLSCSVDQSTEEIEPETLELVDVPSEPFVGIETVSNEAQRSEMTHVFEVE